ncbi:MAG: hypothetical protein COV46_02910 [Deltaproteobacteria bacterium CG11_big_fil_rev_8_21_14_0_20_49_13]|nr:MAG: hypothetical protein COV46_02910 [Deltaproteobacteria bacterium CG11_big_fil_rev_8_21_14_0_20_49_13]
MKEFSGKFVLRIPLELHKKLANMSISKRVSLNQLCVLLLNRGLGVLEGDSYQEFEPVVKKLKEKFKDKLSGVVLFGSKATGEATESSDIDLLVILDGSVEIDRSLYSWWDDNVIWSDRELNPHFVSQPKDISEVSGLWFEVSISGKIIYQRGMIVDSIFAEIKKFIADGLVRRYISNGHPYWVRRITTDEE